MSKKSQNVLLALICAGFFAAFLQTNPMGKRIVGNAFKKTFTPPVAGSETMAWEPREEASLGYARGGWLELKLPAYDRNGMPVVARARAARNNQTDTRKLSSWRKAYNSELHDTDRDPVVLQGYWDTNGTVEEKEFFRFTHFKARQYKDGVVQSIDSID
ncbi:MAG: hypothetical protein QF486_02600 [Candidatus Woesearchaeota archaeon]|jgi:hypothetical protein|nr:hypothetical protein [Candidatus Woesearchaeota archaeon]MDP7181443.1 hypothetical protein [Candidatus Woesearchaeota archaeon]MDP7198485.1 hypothetical protein [Candidatus Woesearchaeota archaeon]MDP7466773.1 hypothetical protein [Candidatus Woesearchaeota archaeon]MDP7647998.1 hypothetical protein [Candidatus Woesearchaeota archaeon]